MTESITEREGKRVAAHSLINQAEEIARYLRLATDGQLSLAVVDNHGKTLREREGMGWHDAHLAADKVLKSQDPEKPVRRAHVLVSKRNRPQASEVEAYLPANYRLVRSVLGGDEPYHEIEGTDEAGWTLDDYVIPRLASGLISAREVQE